MNSLYTTFAQVTQGIDNLYVAGEDLENEITSLSIRAVVIAAIVLVVLTVVAALLKNHAPKLKLPLFIMMAFTMSSSFLLLAGSTVYLNVKSDSGGPVHWHADLEYWICDNQVELRNPTGTLSNKIGTSVLHEHDDQRIHLEGVVVDGIKDATLGKFMHVVDGAITDDALVMPLNAVGEGEIFEDNIDSDGPNDSNAAAIDPLIVEQGDERFLRAIDGQSCGDQEGDVQVFVFQYNEDDKTYAQTKLSNPQDYIIRDDPNVPPGDCIVVEFSPTKPFTDKLCEQYEVRDVERCVANGVDIEKVSICEIRDVTDYEGLQASFQPVDDEVTATERSESTALKEICQEYYNEAGELLVEGTQDIREDGRRIEFEIDCAEYRAELLFPNGTPEGAEL